MLDPGELPRFEAATPARPNLDGMSVDPVPVSEPSDPVRVATTLLQERDDAWGDDVSLGGAKTPAS